jgi:Fe-Mn family superoxide dismutase
MITNRDVKNIIRDSLGMEESTMTENLVIQQKTINLKTDYLSKASIQNHLELYDQYVKDFNRLNAEMGTANREDVSANDSDYRSIKIDETYSLNAAYLHELYFANIGDNSSQIGMDSLAYMRLARDFGTFDAWQKDFIACCMASRSGWAMTYLNLYTKQYMNCFIDLNSLNVPVACYPVIVMDVWQHAYYRDYLKDVKTYTYAMMKQLRWPLVERRIEKCDSILEAMK